MLVHQLQTVGERVAHLGLDDVADHDVADRRGFWRFSDEHETPYAIAFRETPDDGRVLDDHEKADILVGHEMHRRERAVPGLDSPQRPRSGGKNLLQRPVGKDLFGVSERAIHDASPARLYEQKP